MITETHSHPSPAARSVRLQTKSFPGFFKPVWEDHRVESPSQTRSLSVARGMDTRTGSHGGGSKMAAIARSAREEVPYPLYSSLDQGGFPKAKASSLLSLQELLGILPCPHPKRPQGHVFSTLLFLPGLRHPACCYKAILSSSWQEGLLDAKGRGRQACTWHLGCHILGCP